MGRGGLASRRPRKKAAVVRAAAAISPRAGRGARGRSRRIPLPLPPAATARCPSFLSPPPPPQREIVEGGEGEIRAAFFVFAVTREVDPATGALAWRIVEMSMQGSMLYL